MPATTTPLVVDGLWRCLCPVLERPGYAWRLQRFACKPKVRKASTSTARPPANTPLWPSDTITRSNLLGPRKTTGNEREGPYVARQRERQAPTTTPFFFEPPWRRTPTTTPAQHRTAAQSKDDIEELKFSYSSEYATEDLYEKLGRHATKGDTALVKWLVNYLVEDRHELPNERLYAALIRVNVNEQEGSAGDVLSLLQELREEGLTPSGGLYHDVLKVLAVHPDYLLRDQILQEMRGRWLALTPTGWHDVVAGLLREQQYELALNKIQKMQEEDVPIQGWLFDMAIYSLVNADELDEALRLMKERVATTEQNVSSVLWYYLLDGGSRAYHYPAVHYVWRKRVETLYLNPPSGICLNVLNTAARQGDAQLATDVFRVLANRATVFEHQHYEMLIDAYMASGDLRTALTILCVMQGAGTKPNDSTTRSIFEFIKRDLKRCDEAFNILRSLHHDGRPVPTAGLNAVLEATVFTGDLSHALEQYKALHLICPSGPTTETFNTLFKGCHIARRKDLAMFLASEMRTLKIKPDALTYDRLLLVCLHQDNYEDAFRYYEEMKSQGFLPRSGTWPRMVQWVAGRNDPRCWDLMVDMKENGLPIGNLVRWLQENWTGRREAFKEGMRKVRKDQSTFEETVGERANA